MPLTTIGIIIVIAIIMSILVRKFKQNPVLGYIVAGFLLGPVFLGFLHPTDPLVIGFAEMGLFILLFYLGLELSLKDFLAAGTSSFFLALLDIAGSILVGVVISQLFGFSLLFSLAVGLMLFSTSTAIVAKFALDNNILKLPSTQIAISILILQDFLGIIMIVFLTSLSSNGESALDLALSAVMFAIAAFFVVYQLGQWFENWFKEQGYGHIEITLFALGIGLIVATLADVLNLSTALGAYFAGFALAETRAGKLIKKDINFLRDFFLVFFFVSFGTTIFFNHETNSLVIPNFETLVFLIVFSIALVFGGTIAHGTVFSIFGPLFGLKRGLDTSRAAILLGPLGEFVVIIATASLVMLSPQEALVLPTVSFLIIAVSVIVFSPLYANAGLHARVFGFLPEFFKLKSESRIVEHNDYSLSELKKIGLNSLIIVAMAWIAFLLYLKLPRLGVPLPYGRGTTTLIVFLIFAALPFFRILRSLRNLFKHYHLEKLGSFLVRK